MTFHFLVVVVTVPKILATATNIIKCHAPFAHKPQRKQVHMRSIHFHKLAAHFACARHVRHAYCCIAINNTPAMNDGRQCTRHFVNNLIQLQRAFNTKHPEFVFKPLIIQRPYPHVTIMCTSLACHGCLMILVLIIFLTDISRKKYKSNSNIFISFQSNISNSNISNNFFCNFSFFLFFLFFCQNAREVQLFFHFISSFNFFFISFPP